MTTRLRIENAGPNAVNIKSVATSGEVGGAQRLEPGQGSEHFWVHELQSLRAEEIPGTAVIPSEAGLPMQPTPAPAVVPAAEPTAPALPSTPKVPDAPPSAPASKPAVAGSPE